MSNETIEKMTDEQITNEIKTLLHSKGEHVATGEISFPKNADKEYINEALKNDVLKDITPTYDEINKVQKFREYTLSGLAHYIGDEAIGLMKKDQSLNKVVGELKYGNDDELYIGINRTRNVPEANGNMKEVYGSMIAKVKCNLPTGNLKRIKEIIKTKAMDELIKD